MKKNLKKNLTVVYKNPHCQGCGKNTNIDNKDYYMVRFDIWKKIEVGDNMLCMNCMEERLGHKILAEEILICPLIIFFNYYTKEILLSAYSIEYILSHV